MLKGVNMFLTIIIIMETKNIIIYPTAFIGLYLLLHKLWIGDINDVINVPYVTEISRNKDNPQLWDITIYHSSFTFFTTKVDKKHIGLTREEVENTPVPWTMMSIQKDAPIPPRTL